MLHFLSIQHLSWICQSFVIHTAQIITENLSFSEKRSNSEGSVIQKPLFPLELNGKVGNTKWKCWARFSPSLFQLLCMSQALIRKLKISLYRQDLSLGIFFISFSLLSAYRTWQRLMGYIWVVLWSLLTVLRSCEDPTQPTSGRAICRASLKFSTFTGKKKKKSWGICDCIWRLHCLQSKLSWWQGQRAAEHAETPCRKAGSWGTWQSCTSQLSTSPACLASWSSSQI